MAYARRLTPMTLAALALAATPLAAPSHASPTAKAARHCHGADVLPKTGHTTRAARAVLCLVNRARRSHGLRALSTSHALQRAAQSHSTAMVRSGSFSHGSVGGRASSHGYRWRAIGENIGEGTRHVTPRVMVSMWMHSAPHRANILSHLYRDAGVGIAHGVPGRRGRGRTYTMDFGHRR